MWTQLLVVAMFASGLGGYFWNIGASRLGVAIASLWVNLVPFFALIIQPLLWGWLTCRVMAYDALADFADSDEMMQIRMSQRFPLLMVDRVRECEPGKRIVAIKCVSANEPYFPGHFPNRPIFPVLKMDALNARRTHKR